jgi:hypothetical protein
MDRAASRRNRFPSVLDPRPREWECAAALHPQAAQASNPSGHRVQLDASVRREIWKDLFVALNGYNAFDNRPPNSTANTNDVGVTMSIGWRY